MLFNSVFLFSVYYSLAQIITCLLGRSNHPFQCLGDITGSEKTGIRKIIILLGNTVMLQLDQASSMPISGVIWKSGQGSQLEGLMVYIFCLKFETSLERVVY